jgi:enoyl-CoA hydratase
MNRKTILTELDGSIATLTLNRPDAMNALNRQMMLEVKETMESWNRDDSVRAIIITGSDKAFAAGADIKEMLDMEYLDALQGHFVDEWECIANSRTPTIAAVAGFALGGGCELAMMCDVLIAADNARFGQPEIRIGTLPGLGGTQRLTRLIGKAKAMELCLTGRMMDAQEAERSGLVSRIVPHTQLRDEARKTARQIASYSTPAVQLVRESINAALNTTLEQGLKIERNAFYSLFGTDDQKEGMQAFIEKRNAQFSR